MLNRRHFIKNSTTLSVAGLLFQRKLFSGNMLIPGLPLPGIQLFTFFNVLENDVAGNLKKIAAIGYKEIESAFSRKPGFYGFSAREFNTILNDNGLSWKSHHVLGAPFRMPPGAKPPAGPDGKPISIPPMKNLRDNMQELIDGIAEAGIPYLVCATTPFDNEEELKKSIDTLNKSNEACKKAGLVLAYHNHDAEFLPVNGKTTYDRLLNETDVVMELDLAWVVKAGVDPVSLFKQHAGRFHMWHVKDLDKTKTNPLPVGTGIVHFKNIFENASVSGLRHFFVEHDMPDDPFASITTSMENIKKIIQ